MTRLFLFLLLISALLTGGPLHAQQSSFESSGLADQFKLDNSFGRLGAFGSAPSADQVKLSASFFLSEQGTAATISVTAEIASDWHVYSVTQPSGGPMKSKLTLEKSATYSLAGEFKPDRQPTIHPADIFPVRSEEHTGRVIWTAPLRLSPGIDPETLEISGTFKGQVCQTNGVCIPLTLPFVAHLGKAPAGTQTLKSPESLGEHRGSSSIVIRGSIEPKVATPGSTVRLRLTAEPAPQWHIYAWAEKDPVEISKPTLIVLTNTSGWAASRPETNSPIHEQPSPIPDSPPDRFHDGPTTWTVELKVPADAKPGEHLITGIMGYQVCRAVSCDFPRGVHFQVQIPVAGKQVAGRIPLGFNEASYEEAAQAALSTSTEPDAEQATGRLSSLEGKPVAVILGLAFLAGLILNVMPCVLPVIGLKVMSFVQQAGESRWRIIALNVWYSLGLMSVFMVLATLAVFMNFGWGEHFGSEAFTISMVALVFAFALSFFGVWEIPIPGFVGSGRTGEMAQKEGAAGAFAKGVLTTILATPCSGPFLVPAVGWAIAQPAWLTYTTFASIGLGMASPYLLIGVFPSLVSALPKPGAWMDTFKQSMGFVMMGTVVFLISTVDAEYNLAILSFLVGLALACWILGRTPLTANLGAKLKAWASAGVVAGAIGFVAFNWLVPRVELPWQTFTQATLDEQIAQGHTVLVDFTADW